MKRIMITAAGGPAGFCLIKYLKDKAYVIGTDGLLDSPAKFFCDELHKVPMASSPDYEKEMLDLIEKLNPELIVPTFDEDIRFFAERKDSIDADVIVSPLETVEVCEDKRKMAEVFKDVCPKCYTEEEARSSKPFPLFIRPARGRGSKIGFRVEDEEDLEYALRKTPEPFIQEFLPGPEVTVDTLADFDGKLLGTAQRIRAQTRGGISTKAEFIDDPDVQEICEIVHERLQVLGPTNTQCMKDSEGVWRLMEINPRYSGGLLLSNLAGFDNIEPLLTIDFENKVLEASNIHAKPGTKVVRYWEEKKL